MLSRSRAVVRVVRDGMTDVCTAISKNLPSFRVLCLRRRARPMARAEASPSRT